MFFPLLRIKQLILDLKHIYTISIPSIALCGGCGWMVSLYMRRKWLPCMNACRCAVFHCICIYVGLCVQTNVCVPLYSAKGIDDVALNKKIKLIDWLIDFCTYRRMTEEYQGQSALIYVCCLHIVSRMKKFQMQSGSYGKWSYALYGGGCSRWLTCIWSVTIATVH